MYGSWGQTGVARGDDWATTSRYTNNRTGTTTRGTQTSEGGAAVSRRGPDGGGTVAKTGSGDVYAGKDGNVYRKQGDSWQQYGEGGWNSVDRPQPQAGETGRSGATATESSAAGRGTTTSTRNWDPATASQVNRDADARSMGSQRTSDAGRARSSPTSSSAGSYRPRSGGGGGRRR